MRKLKSTIRRQGAPDREAQGVLREDAKVDKEYFMGVRAAKLVVLQLCRLGRKLRKKREFSWLQETNQQKCLKLESNLRTKKSNLWKPWYLNAKVNCRCAT